MMSVAALNSFLLVFAGLLPIVNPPGSALLFLALTRRGTRAQRAQLARRIATYAFFIMFVSLNVGAFVLQLFGISVPVLQVAGGVVLALAGWRALDAPQHRDDTPAPEAAQVGDLASMAFYPLTMPLTAGPCTVAFAIALGTSGSSAVGMPSARLVAAVLGALVATLSIAGLVYVCYRFADRIQEALGDSGSDALGRLFAFILICIGTQILWTGFAALWMSLPPR
jgi:multiple antibiotic resistance protein